MNTYTTLGDIYQFKKKDTCAISSNFLISSRLTPNEYCNERTARNNLMFSVMFIK